MPYANHIPKISRHKSSGQAIVCLNGHDHYLGTFGSAESVAAYNRLIAEWLPLRQLPNAMRTPPTIRQVATSYKKHALEYYRRADGSLTNEPSNIGYALKQLRILYGPTAAADFGPLKLVAVRTAMIKLGWTRVSINKQIGRVRQFFRWAVSQEIIPAGVYQALMSVRGLSSGRSAAKESDPVRPVPQATLDATLLHMNRQIKAMAQLQLYTGARPGEITTMRMADLDMSGAIWKYRPVQHKTRHHGHDRVILIGPRGQGVLKEFLKPVLTDFIFSPAEAEAERREAAAASRKTPLSCGNRPGKNRQQNPKRKPGAHYEVMSYGHAVAKACVRAGVPHWHVHQLRHNSATYLKKEFGIEAAKTILGHATLSATLLYAEENLEKAESIMAKVG